MKRFLAVWIALLLSLPVCGYNFRTHIALEEESIKHLERLGYTDEALWYDSLAPIPSEGIMWPDLKSTTKDSKEAVKYCLCYTPGCADPGDGNGKQKNLDVTGWVSWLWDEKEIYDKVTDLGFKYLGEESMSTPLAAAEGYYAPGSYAKRWLIHIEFKFLWPRLISLGPIHIPTAWIKVEEYSDSALAAQTSEEAVKWTARILHFFQDISCPDKTWPATEKYSFNLCFPTSCLKKIFANLPAMINHVTYVIYCDWVDENIDTLLADIRVNSQDYPVDIFSVSVEEFPAWVQEKLDLLAQESRNLSFGKKKREKLEAKDKEVKEVRAEVQKIRVELKRTEDKKTIGVELEAKETELQIKEKELFDLKWMFFYPIASKMVPRTVQVCAGIMGSFYGLSY